MGHLVYDAIGGIRGKFPVSGYCVFTANGKMSVVDNYKENGTHTVKDFSLTTDALKYVKEQIAELTANSATPEIYEADMERVNKYIEKWEEREKARDGLHVFRVFNFWYDEDGHIKCHDFNEVADIECKTIDEVPEKVKEKVGEKVQGFSAWLIV